MNADTALKKVILILGRFNAVFATLPRLNIYGLLNPSSASAWWANIFLGSRLCTNSLPNLVRKPIRKVLVGPNDTIPISGASLAYLRSLAEPSQKRRATDKKQRKGCELANFISTTSVGQRQLAKNAPAPDVPMAEVLSLDIGCHDDDSNSDF